jgi:hypothetical protein
MSATVTAASAISAGCAKNGCPAQHGEQELHESRQYPEEHHFWFGCHRVSPGIGSILNPWTQALKVTART